jgi:hypothetical protein
MHYYPFCCQVVSCTWRVQLSLQSEDEDEQHDAGSVLVSSRALAACMRVDSFFAPHLVPSFQAALNILSLQVIVILILIDVFIVLMILTSQNTWHHIPGDSVYTHYHENLI